MALTETDRAIEQAQRLLKHLQAGDIGQAQAVVTELNDEHESDLFSEIGKLTRDLHDALSSFQLDARISGLAAQDIPDAKDRLQYVLKSTADAANRTMDAVENTITLTGEIAQGIDELVPVWERVKRKENAPGEFKQFFGDLGPFLKRTRENSDTINQHMSDALMAQDYQDLTGQVIHRVIKLVQDVEESLVHTIKMFGQMEHYREASLQPKPPEKGPEGPAVDADKRDDVVANQDDVDDLLSSMGF